MIPRPSAQTRPPSGPSDAKLNDDAGKIYAGTGNGMKSLQIPESASLGIEAGHISTPDSSKEDAIKRGVPAARLGSFKDASVDALPFPPRPGQQNSFKLLQLQEEVQNKHQQSRRKTTGISGTVTFDLAPEGRRYPGETPADFNPWSGLDASEHLTPILIKQGLQSSSIVTHEQHTARPSLWPSLRNKGSGGGRSILATLLCSALERRQQFGKLTASSTFKPPPRVALTDKSRETWLLELANPQVPLKKLSRRIPHGIRGKGLLDECLTKKIPPARAVWLSKCVGAQEMRAFKRKGAGSINASVGIGGELKWIKEWTLHVQQFVESVVTTCGTHGWRDNIEYAIRLTATLYSENLLDNDQYLEWILTSLEDSSTDELPIWLMLSQIYFRDFFMLRNRGRRLAEAILTRIDLLEQDNEGEICKPLYQKLRMLAAGMLVNHRACFIAPKQWKTCKGVLISLLTEEGAQQPAIIAATKNIIKRNDSLLRDMPASESNLGSGVQQLVHTLDVAVTSNTLDFKPEQLWEQCLGTKLPGPLAIETIIHWACSHYRSGEADIYLAARLIRFWQCHGHNVDDDILLFIKNAAEGYVRDIDESRAFKIIAELLRSKTFPTGKYLQWLIAVGAIGHKAGLEDSLHRRLLLQLPMHGVSAYLANLRKLLLSDTETELGDEATRIHVLWNTISTLSQAKDRAVVHEVLANLSNETFSVKAELARRLRQEAACLTRTQLEQADKITPSEKPFERKISTISLAQFQTTRTLLEGMGDLCILADVVGLSVYSEDVSVLAACFETLDLHANAFVAIGAQAPLFRRLSERYIFMRSLQPLDRNLVSCFFDLTSRSATNEGIYRLLKLDLSRCDHNAAIQMCSPASDGMGESTGNNQDGSATIEEEIEKALNSGNSMDDGATRRTFAKIVQVVTGIANQAGHMDTTKEIPRVEVKHRMVPPLETWLQKLKAFDERVFEQLVGEWLTSIISEQTPGQSELLSFSVSTIVGSRTLSLQKVVAGARKMLGTLMKIAPKQAAGPALNLLTLLTPALPKHVLADEQHWYKLMIEQRHCQSLILDLLQPLFASVARSTSTLHRQYLMSLIKRKDFLMIVRQQAIHDVDLTAASLGLGGNDESLDTKQSKPVDVPFAEEILNELTDPRNASQLAKSSKEEQIREVISIANEFSLPFCQLKIRSLLNTSTIALTLSADAMITDEDPIEIALLDALKTSICQQTSSLANLVGGLGYMLSSRIRQFAEQQILSAMDDLSQKLDDPGRDKSDASALQRYLSIVDATVHEELTSSESLQLLLPITDKLKSLSNILDVWQDSDHRFWRPSQVQQACVWIQALLRLCVIRKQAVNVISYSDQIALCTVLCSLMLHPLLVFSTETAEAIADLVAFLSDNYTAEMRSHMAKIEAQRHNNNKNIAFFWGLSKSAEAWLGLVTSANITGTSAPTTTPKTSAPTVPSPTPVSPAHAQPSMATPPPVASPMQRQLSGHQRPAASAINMPLKSSILQQAQTAKMNQKQVGVSQQLPQVQARQAQQTWPPTQQQRRPSQNAYNQVHPTSQGLTNSGLPQIHKQQAKEKVNFNQPVPFPLRTWEILPDASGVGPTSTGITTSKLERDINDTSISLHLFDARRVI